MKKLLSCMFILIFTLGIGTSCFGSVRWGVNGFEEFLSALGYDIDFETANYNTDSFTVLNNYLTKTNYPFVIFDMNDGGVLSNLDADVDFVVYPAYTSNAPTRRLKLVNSDEGYYYNFNYQSHSFAVDTTSDTVYFDVGQYSNENWYESNLEISHEEFISLSFQEYLLKESLLFCETSIYASNQQDIIFTPHGGRILNSSFGSINYTGSVFYGSYAKSITLTYTNGFEENTNYDLFLERFTLDDDSSTGTGMAYYALETINLGTVTTSDTLITKDISEYLALGSENVYRICVGINNFDINGSNDVFLCTDWLLPNTNTVRKYPVFSQSHYYQFLDLVAYDPEYSDPIDTPDINTSSGDDFSISGLLKVPSFLNDIKGYYDIEDPYEDLHLYINHSGDYYDISNYYISITPFNSSGNRLPHEELSGDYFSEDNYNYEDFLYDIYLPEHYTFSEEYFYKINLYTMRGSLVDVTGPFCFNNDIYTIMNSFTDSSDEEEVSKNIFQRIADGVLGIPAAILNGIKNLFIPSNGFFESYWNDINTFFNEKLGFLWDAVMFIPTLGETIITLVEGFTDELVFKIPEISVPDFIGGEVVILQPFEWKPREFINSDENIASLYDLYLNLIDFFVAFGLVNYALSVISDLFKIKQGVLDKEPIGFKPED